MTPLFVVVPCECVGGENTIQTFKSIGFYDLKKTLMDGIEIMEENLVFEVSCPKCLKTRRLRIPLDELDRLLDQFTPYSFDFVHQNYVL